MAAVHPLLNQTRDFLAAPLTSCSAEEVARHPAGDPARWNAQQIVEHLCATWRSTIGGLEDRLQKGRPLRTRPTFTQRYRQLAVCEFGFLPKRREAPSAVRPKAAPGVPLSGNELIARFSATLAAMDEVLNRIEPQARDAPVLTHFLLGPLSVRQWRRFHRAHARHHAAQMERAIRGA
ncbi:MAG: DinB family protein [Acidobacteriota bacterium]